MNQDTDLKILLPIMTVVVSGLFALIGAFIGAWLTRSTEYRKWLRQERSLVFAEFLKQLHAVTQESTKVIFDSGLSKGERDQQITDIAGRLDGQGKVVRLYLNHSDRETFSRLLIDYWNLNFQSVKNEHRIKKGEEIRKTIQAMFEKTIHH